MNKCLSVVVNKKSNETDEVASIEFVMQDNSELPEFTAGSHVDVLLSNGIIRQYSLYNSPEERHRYCIGVLRSRDSRGGSVALHDEVEQGDIIQISEPKNFFKLNENATHNILFAGGIGVTPIMAMAERLSFIGASFEIHYCARTQEKMAFREMLRKKPYFERITMYATEEPAGQQFDISHIIKSRTAGANIYVCGPSGYMDAIISVAHEHGFPAEAIHREFFSAPTQCTKDSSAFTVQITSTGQQFSVCAHQTIAEVLIEHGVEVKLSCEQGICGTCITSVIEGLPDHRDLYMSEEEHAKSNTMMLCCSRALSDKIVLDM